MDLRDLKYFETIAELEHLGRAAARLHRSPPALTKCIRRLEAELETPLFERAGRGIRLIVAGSTHPIFRKRPRVQDLAAYRWVLPVASYETELRRWLDRAFDRHGVPPPIVQIETNSVTFLPNMIAQTGLL